MTVAELIAKLGKCEPSRIVRFFVDWQHQPEVDSLSRDGEDGCVIIGDIDMPPECYGEDYKDERG